MLKHKFAKGDYINERYFVRQFLLGGMGEVYVALDISLDQLVVLKTFQLRYLQHSQIVDMFIAEAKTWILLEKHKHIVQVKTAFVVDQQPFIVMEHVDGGDLRQKLRNGPLDLRYAMELAIQFCTGAGYAYHKLKLIHRDIKPENILLTSSGMLKITDFGLSRIASDLPKDNIGSNVAGTPPYMSPEQWIDAELTIQSDIYAFGVVMYEMLTGTWPFRAVTIEGLRKAHEEVTPPKPSEVDNQIPEDLSMIVMKCMEKNPNKRVASYEVLRDQIETVYRNVFSMEYSSNSQEERDVPVSIPELLIMGDSLSDIGKPHEALSYYDKLLDIDTSSSQAWQRKGDALRQIGKHHEAILYLNKALEVEPSNLQAIKGKIRCLMDLGKRQDALISCNESLGLNSNDKDLLRLKRELMNEQIDTSLDKQLSGSKLTISPPSPHALLHSSIETPLRSVSSESVQTNPMPQLPFVAHVLGQKPQLKDETLAVQVGAIQPAIDPPSQEAQNRVAFENLARQFIAAMKARDIEIIIDDEVIELLCSPELADAREGKLTIEAFISFIEMPANKQFADQRMLAGDRIRVSRDNNRIMFERIDEADQS